VVYGLAYRLKLDNAHGIAVFLNSIRLTNHAEHVYFECSMAFDWRYDQMKISVYVGSHFRYNGKNFVS